MIIFREAAHNQVAALLRSLGQLVQAEDSGRIS
jgi:hypothetical protein